MGARASVKGNVNISDADISKNVLGQPSKGLSLEKQEEETKMEKDPVCGMNVDPEKTQWTLEHEGRKYYFCREGCMKAFARGPERFIRAA